MDGSEEYAAMNAELTHDECPILAFKRCWKTLTIVPFVVKHATSYYVRTNDGNVAAHINAIGDELSAMKRRLQE
jgi:hypothetical protein